MKSFVRSPPRHPAGLTPFDVPTVASRVALDGDGGAAWAAGPAPFRASVSPDPPAHWRPMVGPPRWLGRPRSRVDVADGASVPPGFLRTPGCRWGAAQALVCLRPRVLPCQCQGQGHVDVVVGAWAPPGPRWPVGYHYHLARVLAFSRPLAALRHCRARVDAGGAASEPKRGLRPRRPPASAARGRRLADARSG